MSRAVRLVSSAVVFLSLVGIAFTIRFMISGGGNEGFEQFPTVTNLHVIPGLLYLGFGPLQFSKSIRRRYPDYHRWTGRLLVAIGLVLGASALFLGIVIPFSGLPEQVVIGAFGAFFLFSTMKGYQRARAGHFARHREWMIRAFAIGLSIVTMRLIFIPVLIAIGNPTLEQVELYSIVSFTTSFILHSLFAEVWIWKTRPERVVSHPPMVMSS